MMVNARPMFNLPIVQVRYCEPGKELFDVPTHLVDLYCQCWFIAHRDSGELIVRNYCSRHRPKGHTR